MEAGGARARRPYHDSTFASDKLHLRLRKQAVPLSQLLRDCHLAFARDLHVSKVLLSGIRVKRFGRDEYAGAGFREIQFYLGTNFCSRFPMMSPRYTFPLESRAIACSQFSSPGCS